MRKTEVSEQVVEAGLEEAGLEARKSVRGLLQQSRCEARLGRWRDRE